LFSFVIQQMSTMKSIELVAFHGIQPGIIIPQNTSKTSWQNSGRADLNKCLCGHSKSDQSIPGAVDSRTLLCSTKHSILAYRYGPSCWWMYLLTLALKRFTLPNLFPCVFRLFAVRHGRPQNTQRYPHNEAAKSKTETEAEERNDNEPLWHAMQLR
jgi:hypothetical protein